MENDIIFLKYLKERTVYPYMIWNRKVNMRVILIVIITIIRKLSINMFIEKKWLEY
jgi:hypothetical protein